MDRLFFLDGIPVVLEKRKKKYVATTTPTTSMFYSNNFQQTQGLIKVALTHLHGDTFVSCA